MHRIDGDANVANMFDEGDPGVPRLPTQITAKWLNAVQEELANVIEATGAVLSDAVSNQLKKALGLLGSGVNAAAGARWFSDSLTVDTSSPLPSDAPAITGITQSSNATDAGVRGKTMGNGPGVLAEAALANGPALEIKESSGTAPPMAKFTGVNPATATAFTNTITPAHLLKGWAYVTWNNGAPTLVSGVNMASVGNPAAGRIQLNAAAALAGAMVVVGNAGAGAWHVVPINITGLVEVQDNTGAAVNFGVTSGFAFLAVLGLQ